MYVLSVLNNMKNDQRYVQHFTRKKIVRGEVVLTLSGRGGGGGGLGSHRRKSSNEILPGVDLQVLLTIESGRLVLCF